MECIPEEGPKSAYDNQAYISIIQPVDSGFDSYENIQHPEDYPSYENLEDESYEKIDPPKSYQSSKFSSPPSPLIESYENLSFQSPTEPYQNLIFQNEKSEPKKQSIPVYATLKKAPMNVPKNEMEEEDSPVYENYDFHEQAIYQNVVVKEGKMRTVSEAKATDVHRSKSTDVYAQVRMLRRSVQEVNSLLEQPKKSELIL